MPELEITNEQKLIELERVERNELAMCSYNGRPGCMCGCNGKYSYTKKLQKFSGKNRGYSVDDDEISDIAVKRMINKFKKLLKSGEKVIFSKETCKGEGYFFYETPTRYNAIYFK